MTCIFPSRRRLAASHRVQRCNGRGCAELGVGRVRRAVIDQLSGGRSAWHPHLDRFSRLMVHAVHGARTLQVRPWSGRRTRKSRSGGVDSRPTWVVALRIARALDIAHRLHKVVHVVHGARTLSGPAQVGASDKGNRSGGVDSRPTWVVALRIARALGIAHRLHSCFFQKIPRYLRKECAPRAPGNGG